MRRHLVVFVKEPVPGRVKTRLARGIGAVAAGWWFRHQALAAVRRLGRDRRWTTWLAVSPDREGLGSRVWPRGFARIAQGRGDLGARMARVFRALPPGPAVIVGADIPDLMPRHVAGAFALLGRAEAVIGPAEDGGYWSIGLRRGGAAVPAGFLRQVRWSGPEARADTERGLAPLSVAHAATLRDVDEPEDLRALRRQPPSTPSSASARTSSSGMSGAEAPPGRSLGASFPAR